MSKLNKQVWLPFTQINNDLLNDKRLSAKAKWLYCYLYSKPDKRDFACDRIANDFDDWVKSIQAGMLELENCWWIKREKQHNWKVDYTIFRSYEAWTPKVPKGIQEGISNTDSIVRDIPIDNDKYIDNKKKENIRVFSEEVEECISSYIQDRKQRKKTMSDLAITKLRNKLKWFNATDKELIQTINKSIIAWYTDVYEPIKDKQSKPKWFLPIDQKDLQDVYQHN